MDSSDWSSVSFTMIDLLVGVDQATDRATTVGSEKFLNILVNFYSLHKLAFCGWLSGSCLCARSKIFEHSLLWETTLFSVCPRFLGWYQALVLWLLP